MSSKPEQPPYDPRCSCWNPARSYDMDCRVHGVHAERARAKDAVTDRIAAWAKDDGVERRG